MRYKNNKKSICRGHRVSSRALTLVEMAVALAMMAIVFAAILPLFKQIRDGWDSKQRAAETLQNGRILIDHLNHNLSKAVRITAVSDSSETNGYIGFEDNDAETIRYDVNSTSNYVEFGYIGDLDDLAGPVSKLQFTCYDVCDLDTPITDVNSIRFIKVDTTVTDSTGLGKNINLTANFYLRTNSAAGTDANLIMGTPFEYDTSQGEEPALAKIDTTHYLCAYKGDKSDGWAVVLAVDTVNRTVSRGNAFEFDDVQATSPALTKIDDTHYLCVYTDKFSDGQAVVLTVNTGTWDITKETPFEYDTNQAVTPALAKIDDTHYLCVYTDKFSDGQAVVLIVNTGTWNITKGTPLEYDTEHAVTPALAKIDDIHYLCVYTDKFSDGHAVVLTVDNISWTISCGTNLKYEDINGQYPSLAQIDTTHYLCAYTGPGSDGWAVVLTVDNGTWAISAGTKFIFDDSSCDNATLAQIDTNDYLCAYSGSGSDGWAVVLAVESDTWVISKGVSLEFDSSKGTHPALAQIDQNDYLCVYEDSNVDGQAVVLTYNPAAGPPVSP